MSRLSRRALLVALLATSLCCRRHVKPAAEPVAIAALSLDGMPGHAAGAIVGFVSDDLIAIGRRRTFFFGTLTAVQWKAGRLAVRETREIADYKDFIGGLFPAGGGRFISNLTSPPELLAADLSTITDIPTKFLIAPVGGGSVAGELDESQQWKVYPLSPESTVLRQGTRELLSLSDDLVVFRANDKVRIEKMTGQPVGSFPVPPRSTCYAKALLLPPDRLYLKRLRSRTGCRLQRQNGNLHSRTGRLGFQIRLDQGRPPHALRPLHPQDFNDPENG